MAMSPAVAAAKAELKEQYFKVKPGQAPLFSSITPMSLLAIERMRSRPRQNDESILANLAAQGKDPDETWIKVGLRKTLPRGSRPIPPQIGGVNIYIYVQGSIRPAAAEKQAQKVLDALWKRYEEVISTGGVDDRASLEDYREDKESVRFRLLSRGIDPDEVIVKISLQRKLRGNESPIPAEIDGVKIHVEILGPIDFHKKKAPRCPGAELV